MSAREVVIEECYRLLSKLNAPTLDRWDECAAVTARHADGPSAWEALVANGLVAESWLSDSGRWFGLPTQFYRRKRALDAIESPRVQLVSLDATFQSKATTAPLDRQWATMLAAMGPTLGEVESLARECVARSRALLTAIYGRPAVAEFAPTTTLWRGLSRRRIPLFTAIEAALKWTDRTLQLRAALPPAIGDAIRAVFGTASSPMQEQFVSIIVNGGRDRAQAAVIVRLLCASKLLQTLVRVGPESRTAFSGPSLADALIPARASLCDPFEPLLAIIERGCALRAVFAHSIVVSTPAPPPIRRKKSRKL